MTEHSANGWPASPDLLTRTIVVAGASFRVADDRDVETVFVHLLTRYAAEVEPLDPAQCGGFNYRPNRNNPSQLSNHSSGTALDVNSLRHPNNTPTRATFTAAQVAAVHAIYDSVPELSELVHWGGDWGAPLVTDSMHHELHDHDLAKLARVAERIREADDMTPAQEAKLDAVLAKLDDLDKVLARITKSKRDILAEIADANKQVGK
jgi:hypothetical protein